MPYRLDALLFALGIVLTASGCATTGPQLTSIPDAFHLPANKTGGRAGTVQLARGEIVATQSGQRIDRATLLARLRAYDVVYVGESHGSRAHQKWQAAVIEALAKDKRPLAVGVEWLPQSVQPTLDQRARYDERAFAEAIAWFKNWGYDYRFYQPVFRATARYKVPLLGLNVPRKWVRALGRRGYAKLAPELRAQLPPLDFGQAAHRRIFKAMLGPSGHAHGRKLPRPQKAHGKRKSPHGKHPKGKCTRDESPHAKSPHAKSPHGAKHGQAMLDRYYQAQVLWDTAMATAGTRWLDKVPKGRLVVLAGAGHVIYDRGISARLRALRPQLKQAIVLPVRVGDKTPRPLARQLADYLIGVAPPSDKERFTPLGLRLVLKNGAVVVEGLSKGDTAARRAKLQVGDQLLSLDGRPLRTLFEARWALVGKVRGDTLRLHLRRSAGKTKDSATSQPARELDLDLKL